MSRTKYYHANEVAELLGITINEVRSMLHRKELKGHKLGRRRLVGMEQPIFQAKPADASRQPEVPTIQYIKDSEHEKVMSKQLNKEVPLYCDCEL